LREADGDTRLTWRVSFEARVPGTEALFVAVVRPRLRRSLRALADLAAESARR
jgi:hypothetical protein